MNPIHIIAEAGNNHNGDPELALRLVDVAADAGADSVKFQIINTDALYLPGDYPYGHYDIAKVLERRRSEELDRAAYEGIAMRARERGIGFSSSVFDPEGLALLTGFRPPYVKIASCDLNNIRFLRKVAAAGVRIVLSTGMSDLSDVDKAVEVLRREGVDDLVILHCVSVYPAPLGLTNLRMIGLIKERYGTEVGFSDHTEGAEAACMAMALGATWFEKHFTNDRSQEGFDHAHAADPAEFKRYVSVLRDAWNALHADGPKISEAERYTRRRARRGIYASCDLDAGHVLTESDILVVRPEGPMDADLAESLEGKVLKSPLKAYEPFVPSAIEDAP